MYIPLYRYKGKASLTVFRRTLTYLQGFFINISENQIIKYVLMCRNFTIPLLQTILLSSGLKTIYRRHKINIDFTVSL